MSLERSVATTHDRSLSPNQLAKRDALVDAAVQVLLRDGVAGCTVRALAERAGVSKGVVHYYFADVDEIVDRAMRTAVEIWLLVLAGSDPSGDGDADGEVRFWRAIDACRRPFAHGDRTLMPLWFEYWTQCTRRNRLGPLREMQQLLVDSVDRLLGAAGVERAPERAISVTAYLFGVSMHQAVELVDDDLVEHDIALLSGVERPS